MDTDIHFAGTDAERAAVARLLTGVSNELGHGVLEAPGEVVAAAFLPNGQAVGAAWLHDPRELPEQVGALLDLSRFDGVVAPEQILSFGPVVIAKVARLGWVPIHLFQHLLTMVVEQEAQLLVGLTPPYLTPVFHRLGFRPLGTGADVPGWGVVVPQALVVWDVAHHKKVRSPLAAKDDPRADNPTAKALVGRILDPEAGKATLAPVGPTEVAQTLEATRSAAPDERLFHELTDKQVKVCLAHAEVLSCDRGERVVAEGDDTEHRLYVVLEGAVEARADGRRLGVLPRGAVFGEIAFLLGGHRTADVLALENGTRVVALSERHIHAVGQVDAHIGYLLMRNLARILCRRLVQAR